VRKSRRKNAPTLRVRFLGRRLVGRRRPALLEQHCAEIVRDLAKGIQVPDPLGVIGPAAVLREDTKRDRQRVVEVDLETVAAEFVVKRLVQRMDIVVPGMPA
jgi:hypothetical protein